MVTNIKEVDNRMFLLGLDVLYRDKIKKHEKGELLDCARIVSNELKIEPANVPVEGYYHEEDKLSEYFLLMRALQLVSSSRKQEVCSKDAIERLIQVTSSKLYGFVETKTVLLGTATDPLTEALRACFPKWNIDILTHKAYELASRSDDYSLVALASLAKDPLVLASMRESAVLYAAAVDGCAPTEEIEEKYVWSVDPAIEERAVKFVSTFNNLFNEDLPLPSKTNAELYFDAADPWGNVGRCVRLGYDDSVEPIRHYHWGIKTDNHSVFVEDFWDTQFWTTKLYSEKLYNEI